MLARPNLLNRRDALLLGAAACTLACPESRPGASQSASASAPKVTPPSAATPSGAVASSAPTSKPLDVVTVGPMKPDEKGGQLVVLLHGWGARGDDLVPLARALAWPQARFLVPAAPLPESGEGRAWWHLDPNSRPAHATSDELPADHHPNAQITASRHAVQALLRDAKERYAPESIAIAGFSQGAMLSLDVALAADPAVDRVAVLSGVLLADSLPALRAQPASAPRPAVLVTHGSSDPILPFRSGERIASVLEPRGYRVTWIPFEGGHEIPPLVVKRLREFLFGAAP